VLNNLRLDALPSADLLELGGLSIDVVGREVFSAGARVVLTRREFDVLCYLARRRGRVVTREALLLDVWGSRLAASPRTVDIHIHRMRNKLGAPFVALIESLRGVGYKLLHTPRTPHASSRLERDDGLLKTTRLVLRPPRLEDAATIFQRYACDPEVTRYLTWRPAEDVDSLAPFLQHSIEQRAAGSQLSWVLCEAGDDSASGMITLRLTSSFKGELGYVLARPLWGRGYMAEAVQAVSEHALHARGLHRVFACCDVANAQSARVLEKAGFGLEGLLRRYALHPNLSSEPRDVVGYAIWR
jgi:[ribosomal protein S5]-alanine N-acetyltransferase